MSSRCHLVSTASLLAIWSLPPGVLAQAHVLTDVLADHTRQQIEEILSRKAQRPVAQRRLSARLVAAMAGSSPAMAGMIYNRDNQVLVDITLGEVADDAIVQALRRHGARTVDYLPNHRWLRAWVSMAQLEAIAELGALQGQPQVRFIREAIPPVTQMVNVSQGDGAHRADQARVTLGVDGQGVLVCVLSDGIDTLGARQATGDLPSAVSILPGEGGVGDEGTAMLEIVHDLAPGSSLGFATALGGEARFATNIQRLRFEAGCDVLVDDVAYFTEGVFQDDIIAQAVDAVVADGALYVSAAGNSGNLNDGTAGVWEGDYTPAGNPLVVGQLHSFGASTANAIAVDSPFFFTLQWSDPLGASNNDYDLFLVDAAGNVLAASTNFQTGGQDPFEIIDSRSFDDTGLQLVITKAPGAAPRFLHLNANRGQLAFATAGQTSGHSAAQGALSVAAVDWREAGPVGTAFDGDEVVEPFSSDGPRRIFFSPQGLPLTPGNLLASGGEVRLKPDLAAADGVSTAAPGFDPFFGTSAAAPHVAAIAALGLSLDPVGGAEAVRQALTTTALDIEALGLDRDAGAGIVDAFAVVAALQAGGGAPVPPSDVVGDLNGDGCLSVVDLRQWFQAFFAGNRVESLDVDGDGAVSLADFNQLAVAVQGPTGCSAP